MTTFQQIIDSARVDLQDAEKVRYTDAELIEYANDGVREAFRIRPDFRIGSFTAALPVYGLSDDVPMPETYAMLLKHYVVFRSEARDDEYNNDGRAALFMARFETRLQK
jgi:hypothetical protein